MAYKMKGFGGFKASPAKQEGPIDKKQLKLLSHFGPNVRELH